MLEGIKYPVIKEWKVQWNDNFKNSKFLKF